MEIEENLTPPPLRRDSPSSEAESGIESARAYFSSRRCRARISQPRQLATATHSSWDSNEILEYIFPRGTSSILEMVEDDDVGTNDEEEKEQESAATAPRYQHVAGHPGLKYVSQSRIVFWTENEARTILRDKGLAAANQWAENTDIAP